MNVMRTLNNHSQSSTGSGTQHSVHVPVLLQEVLAELALQDGETVLDGTLGGGGHAAAMAQVLGSAGTLIGIDADSAAIERARHKIESSVAEHEMPTSHLVQDNFRNLGTVLDNLGITNIDAALFDLGLSSDQLEVSGRGFTFQGDEALEMTLSNIIEEDTLTAKEIVNKWAEESLADIIYGYGGERYARRIARAIVEARSEAEIATTAQLVEIIKSAVPGGRGYNKVSPATKTFQALRIAVNDELGAVHEGLEKILERLSPGGRIVVISFHSLEDRVVKRTFKKWKDEGLGEPTTKKPITPNNDELSVNRRARSSKLRVFRKF